MAKHRKRITAPIGYILSETADVVSIVTMRSKNGKTGKMAQVWILHRHIDPLTAVKTGADVKVCGNCKHRGTTCYVQIGRAPMAVWKAYKRGAYQRIKSFRVFNGKRVRLGAYGDPAFMPRRTVNAIVAHAEKWTGYTHQWTSADWLRGIVMASVDSPVERAAALAMGWRLFEVGKGLAVPAGSILCPASDEAGKRTQCIRCVLCDGARPGDARKNIYIPVHGAAKGQFQILQ